MNKLGRPRRINFICTVDGCDTKAFSRSLCQMHYMRVRRREQGCTPRWQFTRCYECGHVPKPGRYLKRGLCYTCYERYRRRIQKLEQACVVRGCHTPKHVTRKTKDGRGPFCLPHYEQRHRLVWDVTQGWHLAERVLRCGFCGEQTKNLTQGLCRRHYIRWLRIRHGVPVRPLPPDQCEWCGRVPKNGKYTLRVCRKCYMQYRNRVTGVTANSRQIITPPVYGPERVPVPKGVLCLGPGQD